MMTFEFVICYLSLHITSLHFLSLFFRSFFALFWFSLLSFLVDENPSEWINTNTNTQGGINERICPLSALIERTERFPSALNERNERTGFNT